MSQKHPIFGRYRLAHGEFTVPRVVAERGEWQEIDKDAVDKDGVPLPPKLHTSKAAQPRKRTASAPRKSATPKPRAKKAAATPTDPETVSGDTPKE